MVVAGEGRGGGCNGGISWLIKKMDRPPDSSELFYSNKLMTKPTHVHANLIRDAPTSFHFESDAE